MEWRGKEGRGDERNGMERIGEERNGSLFKEVKMSEIVALSKYGFKLDSLKNDWEKVDKTVLSRDVFKSLKKGDCIEVKERNKKDFIMDFVLVEPDNTSKMVSGLLKTFNQSTSKALDDRAREILKGQCLNIACAAIFHSQDIGFDSSRSRAIKYAQRLFVELEEADYYNW